MKEFLVGIDFGHGETAAWVVPFNGNTEIAPEGNSLRLTSSNKEGERQIWSVVYKEQGEVYSLEPKGNAFSPITELKGKLHTLSPQKRLAYKKFISLVVERLLKINQILRWDEAANEWNFDLCIACPTSWNQDEIFEYLQFFNEALSPKNIQVLWIIKESDAAFFSKLNMVDNNGCTLVIDYGSSTIDYTAVENMKKISRDEWSSKTLGASAIERFMMRPTDGLEEFKEKYERAQAIINETGNTHIDIDEILRLECRKAKENLYKDNQRVANVHFNLKTYIPESPRCIFDYDFDLTADNGFGEYCKKVQRSFTEFKDNLNRPVDKIILSGGACVMPWVADMVKEVFDGTRIVDDQFPQYVVANGVALYARTQLECITEINDVIEKDGDFEEKYKEVWEEEIYKLLDGPIKKVCNTYGESEENNSIEFFMNCIRDVIESTVEDSNKKGTFNKAVQERLCDDIKVIVSDVIKEKLGKVGDETWNVSMPETDSISIIPIDESLIEKILNKIQKKLFGIIPTQYWNMRKGRNSKERKDIVTEALVSWGQRKGKIELNDSEYVEALEGNANTMKEATKKCAKDTFHQHELFRTTFTSQVIS